MAEFSLAGDEHVSSLQAENEADEARIREREDRIEWARKQSGSGGRPGRDVSDGRLTPPVRVKVSEREATARDGERLGRGESALGKLREQKRGRG